MLKRYMMILLILTFFTVVSFTQNGEGVKMGEKNTGITQLKEAVGKLSKGMTADEVIQILGAPELSFTGIYRPKYIFSNEESITLEYNGDYNDLSAIYNKDGFNLLAIEYIATVMDFPVFIDGGIVVTSNPVVMIKEINYVPIEDLTKQLGIKVTWNEDKQQEDSAVTGITQMIEAAGKLSKGMTKDEVVQQIGEVGISRVYFFGVGDREFLRLHYIDGELSSVLTRDRLDLLSIKYTTANAANFTILIEGEEPLTSNPIVTINGKTYVPIEDLAEQLGIKVSFNEEKQQLEITTK